MSSETNEQKSASHRIKIVVIGDNEIGKTCLLIAYQSQSGNMAIPSIYSSIHFEKEVAINDKQIFVDMELSDTGNGDGTQFDEETSARIKAYKDATICLLCFSLGDADSLKNTQSKWMNEIKQYAPTAIIVLVGLKSDIRSDEDTQISNEDIINVQKAVNAVEFIETSALKKINVENAFEDGIKHLDFSKLTIAKKNDALLNVDQSESELNRPRSLGTLVKNHQKQWNEVMAADGKKERIHTEDFAELRQQKGVVFSQNNNDIPPPPPLNDDDEPELGKVASKNDDGGALDAPLLENGSNTKKKSLSTVSDYWTAANKKNPKGCCVIL